MHAIRDEQAQAYSIALAVRALHHDILLFACSELAVWVEHRFVLSPRSLRGWLQPLSGPLRAVQLAVDV